MHFDYAVFLDKMIQLDTDEDYALDKAQYTRLLDFLNINNKKDFDLVTFNAMKEKGTNLITFQNIKIVIDTLLFSPISKTMLLIIYRGIVDEGKIYVTLDEYNLIAYFMNKEDSFENFKKNFKSIKSDKNYQIPYSEVVKSLLHKKVHRNENPFNVKIQTISQYSHGCRI